jgi:hypothetical protein
MRTTVSLVGLWYTAATVGSPLASPITAPPADFTPNPNVGGGGTRRKDSAHFRLYNTTDDAVASALLQTLESAYACFVTGLGRRSPGLSFRSDTEDGPFYKTNVYSVGTLLGEAANTGTDQTAGFSFLNVVTQYLATPAVFVHEFGHAMTYAERYGIDQDRTGAWWETVANYVADAFLTSDLCADARARYGQPGGDTLIDLKAVLGDSYQVIVDGLANTGNYYQAWPLFTYLVTNPDRYAELGRNVFPDVWRKHARNSNETPLHVLARLLSTAGSPRIQAVVGRYWARMAYLDIGHPQAHALFLKTRASIGCANLDAQGGSGSGSGRYRVKTARRQRYMGANIIPLKGTGDITAVVTASAPFTATLAVSAADGTVRYTDIVHGTAKATVGSGEEAILVVVNTPDSLLLFDAFSLSSDANKGWTTRSPRPVQPHEKFWMQRVSCTNNNAHFILGIGV